MPITFAKLLHGYPTARKRDLFLGMGMGMGGEWPRLIDDPNYANTCAIRVSLALKEAGFKMPDKYREAATGDGTALILKVATMGKPIDASTIPNKTGILVYHAVWSNATGHFDLWTGKEIAGAGSFSGIKDGYDLELWHLP